MVVGIAAVTFTGFILMLVILKFGRNSKFGIKGKHLSALRGSAKASLRTVALERRIVLGGISGFSFVIKRNAKGRLCFDSNELY